MADYDRFNFDNVDFIYSNNESFRGGFFPIGDNNFWHGGIHLQGEKDRATYVHPVEDGEIIAYRITKEYSSYSDELPKELKKYMVNEAKKMATKEVAELIDASFKPKTMSPDTFVLKDDLDDESLEILKEVFNNYSNNFVLVRHKKNILEQEIVFYTLYMHLDVWNNYPLYSEDDEQEGEVVRPFYRQWKFKVTGDETGPGLLLSSGEVVYPYVRVEEVLNEDGNNVEIEEEDEDRIKVKVLFDYDGSGDFKEGFISRKEGNNEFLEAIDQRKLKIKEGAKVYSDNDKTSLKGEMSKENVINNTNISGEAIEYPRTEADIRRISFSENNFEVYQVEGYILNGGEDYLNPSKVSGHHYVSVESIELYQLDKLVEKIDEIKQANSEAKIDTNKMLTDFAGEKDNKALRVYSNDILKVTAVDDEKILEHFPEAKIVKRIYADEDLPGGECRGWIDIDDLVISPVTYKVLSESITRAFDADSLYVGIDSDIKGLYAREVAESDGQVVKILEDGEELILDEIVHSNDIKDVNAFFPVYEGDDDNKENPYYVKGTVLFSNTEIVKADNGDFNIEDSGNSVTVLDEPIPISKEKTVFGTLGKMGFQDKMIHFELFMLDDSFIKLDIPANDKDYYFKPGVYNLTKKKYVEETVELETGSILKIVEAKEDSDIIKVETYCKPPGSFEYIHYASVLKDSESGNRQYKWVTQWSEIQFTAGEGECDFYEIKIEYTDEGPKYYANKLDDIKGFYVKGLKANDGNADRSLVEGAGNTSDSSYWKLKLPIIIDSSERKAGFLLKSKLPDNLTAYEGGYYELNQSGITWYKVDPEPFEPGGNLEIKLGAETTVRSSRIEIAEYKNKKWLGFEFPNGEKGWIDEDKLSKFEERSFEDKILKDGIILDTSNLNNFFKIVEESDIKKMEDGICDLGELLKTAKFVLDDDFISQLNESLVKVKGGSEEENRFFKPGLIFEKLSEVVSNIDESNDRNKIRLVDYLRRMICKLPTEWEDWDDNDDKKSQMEGRLKGIPYLFSQTRLDEYKASVKELSWFSEVKDKIEAQSNMLYFYHPASFLKSMKNLTAEFNPFAGKLITHHLKGTQVLVKDNPGFGVLQNKNNDVFKLESYYGLTGGINEQYSATWKHEGVDMRSWGTGEIVSFITGKVVESGYNSDYGLFLLIQSSSKPTHFYLIAHLKEKLKEKKSMVKPTDIVAIAGNTGMESKPVNRRSVHLHTSFYKIEDKDFKKIISEENGVYTFRLTANRNLHFNPLDHNDPWRQGQD